jgi:hypothetical protein
LTELARRQHASHAAPPAVSSRSREPDDINSNLIDFIMPSNKNAMQHPWRDEVVEYIRATLSMPIA